MNYTEILEQLDTMYDVQDAYVHRGTLYVVNSYDIPVVEQFLEEMNYDIPMKYVDEVSVYG